MRLASEAGYRIFDFGFEGEDYKKYFCNATQTVREAVVLRPGLGAAVSEAAVGLLNAAGRARGERLRTSVRRRWAAIEACETTPIDRFKGAVAGRAGRGACKGASGPRPPPSDVRHETSTTTAAAPAIPARSTEAEEHPHGLVEQGFATDEALAEVLDRYPADCSTSICTTTTTRVRSRCAPARAGGCRATSCWRRSRPGGCGSICARSRPGWPELWAAAMAEFGKIQATYPGMRAVSNAGQLIMSSPAAQGAVSFRRGRGGAVPPARPQAALRLSGRRGPSARGAMEQVVARQTTEELPYTVAFEADAQVMDLEPGEALTWPLYAPHRVENLDRFCVSLSMDFQTWPSRFRNGPSTPMP